jgi:hypothetical protein
MDGSHFDTMTRVIVQSGTRRWLIRLVASLPVVGVLTATGAEESAAERPVDRVQGRTPQRNRKQRNKNKNDNDHNNKKNNNTKHKSSSNPNQNPNTCRSSADCGGPPCCSGTCCQPPATQCNETGLCCAPNCAGRSCGLDGCGQGGTCGSCSTGQVCDNGTCVCTNPSCPTGACDCNGSCCPDPRQVCGLLAALDGGTGCCFPSGTTGVCNGGNFDQVCCARNQRGGIGVGCDDGNGTCSS